MSTDNTPSASTEIARLAFIYGYPLVYNISEMQRISEKGLGSVPPVPFNEFGHARTLATPAEKFVTINNDTLYSMAFFDLSDGPVILSVPPMGTRYHVFQFIDAWTNNFAYVGTRATGPNGGEFLVARSTWQGETPPGMTRITAPTDVGVILGRLSCGGKEDLPAVHQLQEQIALRPLSLDQGPGKGIPSIAEGVDEGVAFYEKLRTYMAAFPPSERDQALQLRFSAIELTRSRSPYADPAPELLDALIDGQKMGMAMINTAQQSAAVPKSNGWLLTYHVFDFNNDSLGLGTIDSDEWKIGDRKAAYLQRAASARGGLWGNHGYEAAYPMTFVDADGNPLHGANHYQIRFAAPPPVGAFWSITMYDIPNFYLVNNPIDRYSIGDRTPGLQYDADGGLTIYIQNETPSEEKLSNWLPAPNAAFRPVMRLYNPDPAILNGEYVLPGIEKVE